MAKLVMNELRNGVVETLRNAETAMTLSEIASAMGVEKVSSGSTNAMVEAGILKVVGVKKVAVVTYREVNTYSLDADRLAEVLAEAEAEKAKKANAKNKKVDA